MIIEDKNFLSKDNIDFIESYIFSNNFPLYMQNSSVKNDNIKSMTHIVLPRIEERNNYNETHPFYENFVSILSNFCSKNKINYNELLRIAVNFTYNNGISDISPIHIDHNFEHNQLLLYLNKPLDKNCKTVLLDDNNNVVKEIYPEKFKGLFFKKMPHYMVFPKMGERYILVFTVR
jgi:hypothetical protein